MECYSFQVLLAPGSPHTSYYMHTFGERPPFVPGANMRAFPWGMLAIVPCNRSVSGDRLPGPLVVLIIHSVNDRGHGNTGCKK